MERSALHRKLKNMNPYLFSESKTNKKDYTVNEADLSDITINLFRIITNYVKIIIVIDDLQWIDSGSLKPIISTAGFIKNNLIIMGTSRK